MSDWQRAVLLCGPPHHKKDVHWRETDRSPYPGAPFPAVLPYRTVLILREHERLLPARWRRSSSASSYVRRANTSDGSHLSSRQRLLRFQLSELPHILRRGGCQGLLLSLIHIWNGPFRCVNVNIIFFIKIGRNAELFRTGSNTADGSLRRFLYVYKRQLLMLPASLFPQYWAARTTIPSPTPIVSICKRN